MTNIIMTLLSLLMYFQAYDIPIENVYAMETQVYNVDKAEVTVIDETGNLWAFAGCDYILDQNVILIMDNNGTPENIYDDIIIDVVTE